MDGSSRQESRGIGISRAIFFLGYRPTVVIGGAVAGLAILRADSVTVLRDLERRPSILWQSRDETSDHAGLAYAPRMPADHDNCHRSITPFSPIAPEPPIASNTHAQASPEFPKKPHRFRATLCWAERLPVRLA